MNAERASEYNPTFLITSKSPLKYNKGNCYDRTILVLSKT